MDRILSLFIAVIVMLSIFSGLPSYALENREIIAQSAILMDKVTGRVLWEKNSEEPMAMASTTKIMTCILALELASKDTQIAISHRAEIAPKVKLYIKEGETYLLGDLLYALMLESSNDVAVAIAEGVGGSVEQFCKLMTDKAQSIGALNTVYKTPNGLDAEGHYTTAYDLALVTKYALENKQFIEIINTRSHSFSNIKGNRSFTVNNKNAFLNLYEGANGVKTGFTGDAGYCFVGSVKQNGMELIAVVLACGWPPNKTFKWRDTIALMDYGFENYDYKDIAINDKIVTRMDHIIYGKTDFVEGIISYEDQLILGKDERVYVTYDIKPVKEAPIKKGQILGKATIYINKEPYASVDVIAKQSVERIDMKWCLSKVLHQFLSI